MVTPKRQYTALAMDSSVIPTAEVDLTKLTISDDANHALDLSALAFAPLVLLVRADGDFHDGADAPSQTNDIWRDGLQWWAIPANGRTAWNFARRSGAGTVNIYMKLLGSN